MSLLKKQLRHEIVRKNFAQGKGVKIAAGVGSNHRCSFTYRNLPGQQR